MVAVVSYPGVYVQEIPSGVRTIVGVGTSIGLFIGRTQFGEINNPVLCLNYEDYVRNFGDGYANSDVGRAVKLFFANGGNQAYVLRIAKGAVASTIALANEAKTTTLTVTANSAGVDGDTIRVAVSYNTPAPESTFTLDVFRWAKNSSGVQQKTAQETYIGVSLDPQHPRYVQDIVNTNSNLITVTDASLGASGTGYSQSGYAVSAADDTIARAQWTALIGTAATTNRFRISVDNNAAVEVDLSSLNFAVAPLDAAGYSAANLATQIAQLINNKLPAGSSVSVSLVAGPAGPATQNNTATQYLRISSAKGDVLIESASNNDLAVKLMLGTANGGLEVSRYAAARPAPTGYVLDQTNVAAFAALAQNSFNKIRIDGVEIDLSVAPYKLTTSPGGVVGAREYQDSTATNQDNGRDGIREKFGIIAAAITAKRAADSSFAYSAEVWGNRLAIIPLAGSDNQKPVVELLNGAVVVSPALKAAADINTRYYSLGTVGIGPYQSAGIAGSPGTAPGPAEYDAAYKVVDKEVDLFNILVLPADAGISDADFKKLWGPASNFSLQRRAFLLIDPPAAWTDASKSVDASVGINSLRVGAVKDHAAVFYPNLIINENGKNITVGPSGAIAGLFARIDGTRGVWKAPAGTEADLRGVIGLQYKFSDGENGVMNPKGVNTIRIFPNGIVNWGARTLDGDDGFGSEYKYIPIRRLASYIEESLYRGLKWVVFEPNDEPLWSQIRLNVGAFMHNLFRQGAFQGGTPSEAYFVKCDASTTTQNDRNLGIVNIVVGFAPLKPAEFVVLSLQQIAGQIQV